jgi:hypothetical protein
MQNNTTITDFDISKSKVTREAIGLLLFGLYSAIKAGGKVSLTKLIEAADLPVPQILTGLKDCKVIENVGGKASAAQWRWLPPGGPNDLIIEKVFKGYQAQLAEYRHKVSAMKAARNGSPVEESGPAIKEPAKPEGPASIFIRDRLAAIEDRQRYVIDLLETICKAWNITETIGGKTIS